MKKTYLKISLISIVIILLTGCWRDPAVVNSHFVKNRQLHFSNEGGREYRKVVTYNKKPVKQGNFHFESCIDNDKRVEMKCDTINMSHIKIYNEWISFTYPINKTSITVEVNKNETNKRREISFFATGPYGLGPQINVTQEK